MDTITIAGLNQVPAGTRTFQVVRQRGIEIIENTGRASRAALEHSYTREGAWSYARALAAMTTPSAPISFIGLDHKRRVVAAPGEVYDGPTCKVCEQREATLPVYAPDMCGECNRQAWGRVDAAAAKHGPSTPGNNVWD